jgi:hypothetical protein
MSKFRWLLIFGILAGLVLLFFNRLAFSGQILARGDTFLYFYPYWQAAADHLVAGQLPMWNEHLFMGAPFLANSQAGLLYPLNWPLWALLPTPYAVSASIILHIIIAAVGTYLAARRCYALARPAALLAAVLFALGGYLTAQVEHVNQVQGLAWLPWLLAVWGPVSAVPVNRVTHMRRVLAVSLLFSLQFLAGHTQTVFISGVGFTIWLLLSYLGRWRAAPEAASFWRALRPVLWLLPAGLLALLLVAAQLLPTFELAGLSARQGGLPANEALSFSLHPLLLGRALLPAYGQQLFTEYVAFLPLTALFLAVLGGWQWRNRPGLWPLWGLVMLGLFFALGQFNPLYQLLVRLPGFNLFRVPARWLVLYALGMSFLAGWGLQALLYERRYSLRKPLLFAGISAAGLMVWSFLAVPLTRWLPLGAEVKAAYPGWLTAIGWLAEIALLLVVLMIWHGSRPVRGGVLAGLVLVFLFLAGRSLPYNHPTTPAAYFELRAPVTRLLVEQDCAVSPESCGPPPGRVLSLSNIFFDLGDQPELESIYADFLSEEAFFDYLVASKHKAVLSPNLPLGYSLASVDGFDGGVLPLDDYATTTVLLLPPGMRSTDGRLREFMTAVPEARWLDLFNARYLITDKVGDEWRQGVFFDRQHPVQLATGQQIAVGHLPDYEATTIWVLGGGAPGRILAQSPGNQWELIPEPAGPSLWSASLPEPAVLTALTLQGPEDPAGWQLEGLALVDRRDDTFQTLVPGQYRLIHSGDVKIYENLDVLPRAFLVGEWQWTTDTEEAVAEMARPEFNPRQKAVLIGAGGERESTKPITGRVEIREYRLDSVTMMVETDTEALLILADAHYPGWQATIEGEPATIYQADGLFRGVFVPAGENEIVFSLVSSAFETGRVSNRLFSPALL